MVGPILGQCGDNVRYPSGNEGKLGQMNMDVLHTLDSCSGNLRQHLNITNNRHQDSLGAITLDNMVLGSEQFSLDNYTPPLRVPIVGYRNKKSGLISIYIGSNHSIDYKVQEHLFDGSASFNDSGSINTVQYGYDSKILKGDILTDHSFAGGEIKKFLQTILTSDVIHDFRKKLNFTFFENMMRFEGEFDSYNEALTKAGQTILWEVSGKDGQKPIYLAINFVSQDSVRAYIQYKYPNFNISSISNSEFD